MNKKVYTIATRGSKLALWQSHFVKSLLADKGIETELKIIKTKGDRVQDRFLHEMGGKGLFVKELEHAMQQMEADLAVHSLKDLPAVIPHPFILPAVLQRHSPRDVVILGEGSAIRNGEMSGAHLLGAAELQRYGEMTLATSSLRRQSMIKAACPAIKLVPIRGNVDTRIAKLQEHKWDGIILAEAALERLELHHLPRRVLDPQWFIPSPAQGALAIECLEDHPLRPILEQLDHKPTHHAVKIERGVLKALGGDCTMPIGCHVQAGDGGVDIRAKVLTYDGQESTCHLQKTGAVEIEALPIEETIKDVVYQLEQENLSELLQQIRETKPDLGRLS